LNDDLFKNEGEVVVVVFVGGVFKGIDKELNETPLPFFEPVYHLVGVVNGPNGDEHGNQHHYPFEIGIILIKLKGSGFFQRVRHSNNTLAELPAKISEI
jgi:hypothetical protein